ncbi:MAG: four helix bundle protein [Cyclobacteriaceae bacterium]
MGLFEQVGVFNLPALKINILKDKSFAFSVRIVKLYKHLTQEQREFVMSKQLLRSGTAIGAIYREAEQAESRADFIHKISMSLKECNETLYWLELLHATEYLNDMAYKSIFSDAEELIKLLTSILKTSKAKAKASR